MPNSGDPSPRPSTQTEGCSTRLQVLYAAAELLQVVNGRLDEG
jgi:hypothetical protein